MPRTNTEIENRTARAPQPEQARLRLLRDHTPHLPWGEAEALGSDWAQTVRVALGNENRAACGGWPGTLSEARARVTGIVSRWPTSGRLTVSVSEFEGMACVLYASARSAWRNYAEPEKAGEDVQQSFQSNR